MSDHADDEDIPAVVIDCGSGMCRGGFAGDDAPRSVFSSVIGRPRFKFKQGQGDNDDGVMTDHMIGDEAQKCREFLSLTYSIDRGVVTNWDDAEKLWDFCFKDLRVDPSSQPVLMSEPIFNPAGNKERMAETMFETFGVPGYFAHNSAMLSLFASGRGIGIVVDIGEGVTHVVPIYYTAGMPHAIQCQDFGGKDVTLYLQKLLQEERGLSFTTTSDFEYVRELKEHACYLSLDYDKEMSEPVKDCPYVLPDGTELSVGRERFQSAECLFRPSLLGKNDMKGLHEMLRTCLDSCALDNRRDFHCSILLTGGGTMMKNLKERLGKEWGDKLLPIGHRSIYNVVSPPERKYSVWIGGSIAASLSTFQPAWVTKQHYEEFGPTIVHRRCL